MRDGQLEAWITTLAVEGVAATLLARPFGMVPSRAARAAIAGSLFSHPIVWWLHYELLWKTGYWASFGIVELFAWGSEVPFYRLAGASWGRAATMSFLVNMSSILAGLAPHYLEQWLA